MQQIRLAFLGTPRIECKGVPAQLDTRKAVALLAYLAATGEPASRESLVTLLWSRYGRAGGHAALRRTLSTLRNALGRSLLTTERETVGLAAHNELWIDVSRMRELLALCQGHAHREQGVCRECLSLLTEAAKLVRGEFLAGFTLKDSLDFDDWQFFITEKLRIEEAQVLDRVVLGSAASRDYAAAIGYAHQRLGLDRMDEAAHAMLMRLYAWDGNPAAARRQFEELKSLLARELDSEPQEATQRLAEDIARGQPPDPPAFVPDPKPRYRSAGGFTAAAFSTVLVMRTAAFEPGAAESIPKYHGRLLESSEAGFLALFDDGRYLESNPELAIRAALDIRSSAGSRSSSFRGGVATGRLAGEPGGSGDRQKQNPAGRALPFARLLAERAAGGSLLVDELTYHLARDAFLFASTPAATGRGGPAFSVHGVAPLSRKSRGTAGVSAEMVGRKEEVAKLTRAFEKAAAGTGQVVVITGEAGIGKSRLVRELSRTAAARQGVRWLEGRCLAPSTNVGYWPFIDMIDVLHPPSPGREDAEGTLTIDEILSEPDAGRHRGPADIQGLASVTKELLESSRDGPHKTEIQQWSPEQLKHRTFRAVNALFRELALQAPLVLIFEDLHWADTLSLELIDSLLDSLLGVGALLVLVYRNDPGHRSRNLAASAARRRLEDLTEIHLREITREESGRMLSRLMPPETLSAETREGILMKCRGNPYFLEELAHAAAATPESPLPDGIKAVVLSRFNSLSEDGRQVLSYGAVIGRVFPRRLLALAMDREDLESILDDLEDRELLFVERSVPELEYSFKHVLAQEAIYDGLAPSSRIELHLKVARSFELLSPASSQEYCESLAYHFDRGRDVGKAIDFYFLSGERARKGYSNTAAVAYFTRGLELLRAAPQSLTSLDRELEFLIALGVPLVLAKGHQDPTVEAVHLRAREICQERGSAAQLFQVNLGLNRYYMFNRKRLFYGEQMLDIARRMNDSFLISRAHMMLSESFFYLGDFQEMLSQAGEGLQASRPAHSPLDLVQFGNDTAIGCLLDRSHALWCLGFPVRAKVVMQEALERARNVGHAFTLSYATFFAGLLAFMLREQQVARAFSQELIQLARREGFAFYVGNGLVLGGWSSGDIRMVRQGIEMLPGHPFTCIYACMQAELRLAAGETDLAIATLEDSLAVVRSSHLHLWEPEVYRMRGELGMKAGEPEVDVIRWIERSLKLSKKQKARSLELRATMALCRCRTAGGSAELRGRLGALYQSFSEGHDTRDLQDARRLLEAAED